MGRDGGCGHEKTNCLPLFTKFLVLFDIIDASKNECPWDIANVALSHLMGAIAAETTDSNQLNGIWSVFLYVARSKVVSGTDVIDALAYGCGQDRV